MRVSSDRPKIGIIGAIISIDMQEDISGASSLEMYIKRPDGTTFTVTATLSGTDYMTYTTTSDDDGSGNTVFTIGGSYYVDPKVSGLSGFTGYCETVKIITEENHA
jgi:hypothetical protein